MLVIRLSALGDVAIMAPMMQQVAAAHQDVQFTVVAPPMLQPLFADIPSGNVDFCGMEKRQRPWKIYRALKAVGADAVADLHQVNRVGRALMLLRLDACLHLRFTFKIFRLHKGRISRMAMIHHWCMKPRRPQYMRYLDVFRRMKLGLPEAALHPAPHSVAAGCRRVGVAPFAQHAGKVWPLEYTERLVELLADEGCEVLLFGSAAEAPVLESMASRHAGVRSVAGSMDFAEELGVMKSLALMVSMDSSNMHFASAVGTRVVSVWGATHPDFGFMGYGQHRSDAICAGLRCQPCSAFGQKPCRYGDYRCLRAITPEMVFHKVQTLLASTDK